MKSFVSRRGVLSVSAVIVGSLLLSAGIQTPSHALSLGGTVSNVVDTVNTVTQNVPIVRDLPLVSQPESSQPKTSQPSTNTQTSTAKPTATITSSDPEEVAVSRDDATATKSTNQSGGTIAQTAAQSVASIPTVASTANQEMIAAALLEIPKNTVVYSDKKLDTRTANALFFGGIAGMAVGGYALYALRPKHA